MRKSSTKNSAKPVAKKPAPMPPKDLSVEPPAPMEYPMDADTVAVLSYIDEEERSVSEQAAAQESLIGSYEVALANARKTLNDLRGQAVMARAARHAVEMGLRRRHGVSENFRIVGSEFTCR